MMPDSNTAALNQHMNDYDRREAICEGVTQDDIVDAMIDIYEGKTKLDLLDILVDVFHPDTTLVEWQKSKDHINQLAQEKAERNALDN